MAGNLDWESKTNIENQSCSTANCSCNKMWEILQQLSMKYISNLNTKPNQYKLEPGYEARARRIAAVYAKLYLEELNGNKNMIGRYHWVGLGVFASKTVAAIFNDVVTQSGFNANKFMEYITKSRYSLDSWGLGVSGVHSFAKGNLWLYLDISVWHFAWNLPSGNFKNCYKSRNTQNYIHIKRSFENLPWSKSASQIKNLSSTDEIEEGFLKYMVEIEKIFANKNIPRSERFNRASQQLFNHLLKIADQEQRNILQKIVWQDQSVKDGADAQRTYGIPKAQLILSKEYNPTMSALSRPVRNHQITRQTDFEKKTAHLPESPVSLPPQGTNVENIDSRMKWIKLAAEKYHRLMLSNEGRKFLEAEIEHIAGWIDSKWNTSKFDEMFFKISQDSNDGKGG